MQTGSASGMILFEKYIEDLVRKGKVSAHDAKTFLGKDGDATVAGSGGGTKAGSGGTTKVG
jgi:twitching motility protein PilT